MSSILPADKVGRIEWCENHNAPLSTNAVAVGTTTTAVTDLATKTTSARAAYNAQQAARYALKSATIDFNLAVDALTTAAADILKQVKAKAATAGDGVYAMADVPVPAIPSPKPPPGKPCNFTATLGEEGGLTLKWKCPNPRGTSGTIYQIWRRTSPTGEFTYLAGTGTRSFVDATIPAGSTAVTYQIQAVRSTAVGPWAQFNVNFGVTGEGVATATIAAPKLAA
jgi:hypothetical protein